ncbi:hypothetical protein [Anthocerotibacter panamensis]|uniref:hypothetical protein n=1 Tax=Anthocerotibacter panamensis TaxID=2857077 RepID=UPI001C4033DE|nr:hypothetical protein [Anthocerotibacter panamensis]
MNIQLVEALVQVIRALSEEEQVLLVERLYLDTRHPIAPDMTDLAQLGGMFSFLYDDPDVQGLDADDAQ